MQQVSIEEARDRLQELIDAAIHGEEVVIRKDDLTQIKLMPVSRSQSRPQFGSAKGLIKIADDFDAPIGFSPDE